MAEFLSSSSTSEFEGFSDEDNGSSQRSSPKSYADPILSPPNLLAAEAKRGSCTKYTLNANAKARSGALRFLHNIVSEKIR